MNNAQPEAGFAATQAKFAAYIRDPFNNPRPHDVKKQRMDTYRELFFNNVNSFLAGNFPVIKTLLNDEQWNALVQDFFSRHQCETPYFSEIPEEFIHFLQHERNNPNDYPFLLELAHYEWVEMALSIAQEECSPMTEQALSHLAEQNIALSPVAWPLAYQYPVQLISPEFLPDIPPEQPSYLVVYRDHQDDVHFLEINAMTFHLLQMIAEQPGHSAQSLLQQFAEQSQHPNPEAIMQGGLDILGNLANKGILQTVA